MKRYAVPFTLLTILAVALGGWFVSGRPSGEQNGSARAQDGLRGAVKKVVVETAPMLDRFGEWVEAAGGLESETTYTPQGKLLEVSRYRPDGTLDYRLVSRFEDDRLAEETSFGGDQALYRWLYAYDANGRLASLSGYDDQGKLEVKTLYGYDAQNRLLTETSYGADESLSYEAFQSYAQGYTRSTAYFVQGEAEYQLEETFDQDDHRLLEASYGPNQELQYRVEYGYTDRGDLLTESAFAADGSLEYRLENRYDEAGRLLETTEYDAENEPFYRYSYAYNDSNDVTRRESRGVEGSGSTLTYAYLYDEYGNWLERRTMRLVTRSGKDVLEPSEVTRRTLTYY